MTRWLAFIESNTSGTGRLFAQAAVQQGFKPILLTDTPSRYKYAAEVGVDTLKIDTQDERALLEACQRLASSRGLAGITTSSEYFVETSAVLASEMGLPGPPPSAVGKCRDKRRQRLCLQAAGCAVPAFRQATSVGEAVAMAQSIGFPVIVKPVSGSGSVGVRLCRNPGEVAIHARVLLRQKRNERGLPVPRRVLVELLAVGPEYSVETFGKSVVGVTQKYLGELPHFVEMGHDYPAEISASEKKSICQLVMRALDTLGLGWGPAHTELRLTKDGPRIIEVNARLAGGYIPELIRLASGIDLISETIRLVTGSQPELKRAVNFSASIRFIVPEREGILIRAEGIGETCNMPGVVEARMYCASGSHVAHHGDFRDRIGHVIASDATLAGARKAAQSALGAIWVVLKPDSMNN